MKLVLQNIENYGENQVLKKVSFTFERGKIYGLLGRMELLNGEING